MAGVGSESHLRTRAPHLYLLVAILGCQFTIICRLRAQSCATLCDPMDCSQASPSMRFPRQEYCSGLPFPSPGNLPDPGIKPASPVTSALQAGSLPLSPRENPNALTGTRSVEKHRANGGVFIMLREVE